MLADIAPHWEQNFMEKGFSLGKQEGISLGKQEGISIGEIMGMKAILRALLANRFGPLPQWAESSIDRISNANILKNLTIEASRAESLQMFSAVLNQIDSNAGGH